MNYKRIFCLTIPVDTEIINQNIDLPLVFAKNLKDFSKNLRADDLIVLSRNFVNKRNWKKIKILMKQNLDKEFCFFSVGDLFEKENFYLDYMRMSTEQWDTMDSLNTKMFVTETGKKNGLWSTSDLISVFNEEIKNTSWGKDSGKILPKWFISLSLNYRFVKQFLKKLLSWFTIAL